MARTPLSELFNLHGSVALVTGGAMGIGQAIASRLAEAGAAVMLADLNDEAVRHAATDIVAQGGTAAAIRTDVRNPLDVDAAVRETVTTFGHLDILVNNAGVFPFAAALHITAAQWDHVLTTNLGGSFFCAQVAARQMIAQGRGGRIVNIASVASFRPSGNLAHYDASKAGLVMLTKSLALELGQHQITVNAISPGEIDTPGARAVGDTLNQEDGVAVADMASPQFLARIPLGRLGVPDDVATVALFLVSGAANYLTGSCLLVDGGFLLT